MKNAKLEKSYNHIFNKKYLIIYKEDKILLGTTFSKDYAILFANALIKEYEGYVKNIKDKIMIIDEAGEEVFYD